MRRIRETSVPWSRVNEGVSERRVPASTTRCRAVVPLDRVLIPSGSPWGRARVPVHAQKRPSWAHPPLPRRRRSAATNWTTSPVWFHGIAQRLRQNPRLPAPQSTPRFRRYHARNDIDILISVVAAIFVLIVKRLVQ